MGETAAGKPGLWVGEQISTHRREVATAVEVRVELDRILASQLFSRAERPSRLLEFLIGRALTAEAGKVSEYIVATEVFGRKPTFDPTLDAIVRVEIGRLRRKLAEYYRTDGGQDPVVIELPLRTYVPVFHKLPAPPPPKAQIRTWLPVSRTWKAAVLVLALALLLGLASFWAFGRRISPEPRQDGMVSPIAPNEHSIVVLPFRDLSPNHDQQYFCDGLTEELTETLSQVEGLHVVARTTAFHFKGQADDVREIGRQLNVGLVFEGSVRKSGNRLRIAAQLISAADGYHLWSRTYDREVKDALKMQEEIARGIVATVWTGLAVRWRRQPDQRAPSEEAYQHYLKGLSFARQWSMEGLTQAVGELERSVAADPGFAPGHAALARYYALLGVHAGLPPKEVMPKAKASAIKALELDPSLSHAHAALGLVKAVYEWDWVGAGQSFRRAYDLDPGDSDQRELYIKGYLVPLGRLDEALRVAQEVRSRDPFSPRIESILGMVYYFRREYDLAIQQFQKPLRLDPGFKAAHLALGSAYEQKAKFVEAIASMQEGRATWRSGVGASMLGHTYALMGRKPEAEKLIQELVQLSKTRYVSPAYVAAIYAGLGDKDRAIEWLEKAYEVRAASLVYLKVNPRYDGLRPDPRFKALLGKIHLD